jgi:hypothetical protein
MNPGAGAFYPLRGCVSTLIHKATEADRSSGGRSPEEQERSEGKRTTRARLGRSRRPPHARRSCPAPPELGVSRPTTGGLGQETLEAQVLLVVPLTASKSSLLAKSTGGPGGGQSALESLPQRLASWTWRQAPPKPDDLSAGDSSLVPSDRISAPVYEEESASPGVTAQKPTPPLSHLPQFVDAPGAGSSLCSIAGTIGGLQRCRSRTAAATRAAASTASSCSQTRTTSHPASASRRSVLASRRRLVSILSRQNSAGGNLRQLRRHARANRERETATELISAPLLWSGFQRALRRLR